MITAGSAPPAQISLASLARLIWVYFGSRKQEGPARLVWDQCLLASDSSFREEGNDFTEKLTTTFSCASCWSWRRCYFLFSFRSSDLPAGVLPDPSALRKKPTGKGSAERAGGACPDLHECSKVPHGTVQGTFVHCKRCGRWISFPIRKPSKVDDSL